MTYSLGVLDNPLVRGYRGPTGRGSDYIFNKKSTIIGCHITRPLNCSGYFNKVNGLTQNDYLLVKKGFFRK